MTTLTPVVESHPNVIKIKARYKAFVENDITHYIDVSREELAIGVIGITVSPDGSLNVYIGQQANVCRLSILNLVESAMKVVSDYSNENTTVDVYFKDILPAAKFKLQVLPNLKYDGDIVITNTKDLHTFIKGNKND